MNGFPDLVNGPEGRPRSLVLLDATAGLDPRYLLAGGFDEERLPATDFPNTTVVLDLARHGDEDEAAQARARARSSST